MNIKISILNKSDRGTYILVIDLKKSQRIAAGKLPETEYKNGIYLYIGKAGNGLQGRLNRHLKKEKRLFWHIDYLLQKAMIKEIWIKRDFFYECQTASEIHSYLENSIFPQKKFGSSDCNCPSHLLLLPDNKINFTSLRKKQVFEKVKIHGNQA